MILFHSLWLGLGPSKLLSILFLYCQVLVQSQLVVLLELQTNSYENFMDKIINSAQQLKDHSQP